MSDPKRELLGVLYADRVLAHRKLFAHRHEKRTPPAHIRMIQAMHLPTGKDVFEGFRGLGKSTVAEEAVITVALFGLYQNIMVISASQPRAIDRLHSIKSELQQNEIITQLFGRQDTGTWQDDRIILPNNCLIGAYGVGQRIRGAKHLEHRPQLALIDDFEDEDTIDSKEAREKSLRWLYKTLLPAMDRNTQRVWLLGNRLHEEAAISKVAANPAWRHHRIPVMYRTEKGIEDPRLPPGTWASTWPAQFPIEDIARERQEYISLGLLRDWDLEFMCRATNHADALFKREQIRFTGRQHRWEFTTAMVDPARTVKAQSADTGYACWSWVKNRLVVWDAWSRKLLPDQIIDACFAAHQEYSPAELGIEEDGLQQFLLQPLRHEMTRRRTMLPIRPMRAPRNKLDFIRGLQPYFAAGEVEFAKPLPELEEQLGSFPSGRIDCLNALAYALLMRPGLPVFEDFDTDRHVAAIIEPVRTEAYHLAMNATHSLCTGILLQWVDGTLIVLDDWCVDGDPQQAAISILQSAAAASWGNARPLAPPEHFRQWDDIGLRQAVTRAPATLALGGPLEAGRAKLRELLRASPRGEPAVIVSPRARWTLNAMAGGYAREVDPSGRLGDQPKPGVYATLVAGLESFCGILTKLSPGGPRDDARIAYARDGRPYRSAIPQR